MSERTCSACALDIRALAELLSLGPRELFTLMNVVSVRAF